LIRAHWRDCTFIKPVLARCRCGGPRPGAPWRVTHHGRVEVLNAICRAAFLRQLDPDGLAEALADLTSDFASGHLRQADILWRAALNGAAELSQRYTPRLGTRSLDVLHVACARELRLRCFLTFDERQQQLAAAAGLKVVRL
jgi:hypothetical protein